MGQASRGEEEAVLRELVACRAIPAENGPAEASPLAFLHDLDAMELLTLIGDEHPQTIALRVVAQVPAEQAAEVLASLAPDQQSSVVSRIAATELPSREILGELDGDPQSPFERSPRRIPIARGLARVAKMFGAMRPATKRGK